MGTDTAIEWADDTVNFWWGCDEVSPACDNCYARRIDTAQAVRFGKNAHWNDHPRRLRVDNAAAELARNNRRAVKEGKRRRQFINSMSDFFEDRAELDLPRVMALDAIRKAEHCDCLLLTKRPHLVKELLRRASSDALVNEERDDLSAWIDAWLCVRPPANVQVGTTAENQEWLDARFKHLMEIPARVRFLSCEPLLGPLDIVGTYLEWFNSGEPGTTTAEWPGLNRYLHHVIVGGESGDKKVDETRPMHPEWARSLRDQCLNARVPFHFKQWGDWAEVYQIGGDALRVTPDGALSSTDAPPEEGEVIMRRIGKQKAGRILDGRTWDELPIIAG